MGLALCGVRHPIALTPSLVGASWDVLVLYMHATAKKMIFLFDQEKLLAALVSSVKEKGVCVCVKEKMHFVTYVVQSVFCNPAT
jgi:hypothetical protein